jgi:hypothetical protein
MKKHSDGFDWNSFFELVKIGEYKNGGGYQNRTGDLLHAMQALSQLS